MFDIFPRTWSRHVQKLLIHSNWQENKRHNFSLKEKYAKVDDEHSTSPINISINLKHTLTFEKSVARVVLVRARTGGHHRPTRISSTQQIIKPTKTTNIIIPQLYITQTCFCPSGLTFHRGLGLYYHALSSVSSHVINLLIYMQQSSRLLLLSSSIVTPHTLLFDY